MVDDDDDERKWKWELVVRIVAITCWHSLWKGRKSWMNFKWMGKKLVEIQRFARRVWERLTYLKCGKSAYKQNDVIYSAKISNGIMPKRGGGISSVVRTRARTHISLYNLMGAQDCLSTSTPTHTHTNADTLSWQDNWERTSMNNQSCQNPSVNPKYISIHSLMCHSLVNSILLVGNNGRRCEPHRKTISEID